MDVEQPESNGYAKVLVSERSFDNDSSNNDDDDNDNDNDNDETDPLDPGSSNNRAPLTTTTLASATSLSYNNQNWYHKTLLSDNGISIGKYPLVEDSTTVKLIKFIILTFASIALVHVIVKRITTDRDRTMILWHIWIYDTNLIVLDSVVFFVVGRMWRQQGVDHLAWIFPMILCNIYFESQNLFPWLQHSVTLYQMHCIWPWQLWLFVMILVPTIGAVVFLHVKRAWETKLLLVKILEFAFCAFFFVAPVAPSSYFHFHHWFAGWLLGMHCNFNTWWSRAAMAYCWGMYVNGIAVYGRDPLLTCEYAYYLSIDMHCPYTKCYLEALKEMAENPTNATHIVEEMIPVDWKNCSATGYHP